MAKILIIEDEPKIVRTLRLYLEQAGFATAAIYDGREAIPAFRQEKPDLAVAALTRAVALSPDNADAYRLLGFSCRSLGWPSAAEKARSAATPEANTICDPGSARQTRA